MFTIFLVKLDPEAKQLIERLLAVLEDRDQAVVDLATATVRAARVRLKSSQVALDAVTAEAGKGE